MSENSKVQNSMTGHVMLTGGFITTGTIGWSLFRMFKSQQLDYKEMMYAASFAGVMGICLTTAIILKFGKSNDMQKKSMSEKEASNLTIQSSKTSSLATLLDRVNEWDKLFAEEASMDNCLDKNISRSNKQEIVEVSSKYEDLIKKLNYVNRQRKRNELQKLPADNQTKTYYNEVVERSKVKFKEEIISHINELKGYVQGTIDPLPLARDIQFQFTEINDENRRKIAIIVKEYANSMLLKLQKVIDEFVFSVCEAGKVLNDKEHKVKNAFETLGVTEKDLSTAPLKSEINQYYDALEKATKSQIPSCTNGLSSKNVSGAIQRPLESPSCHSVNMAESDSCAIKPNQSDHSLQDRITWTKTFDPQSPIMPKLEIPTGVSVPFNPRRVNKPENRYNRTVKKLKSLHSKPPSKLVLDQEQMKSLKILKSEL